MRDKMCQALTKRIKMTLKLHRDVNGQYRFVNLGLCGKHHS